MPILKQPVDRITIGKPLPKLQALPTGLLPFRTLRPAPLPFHRSVACPQPGIHPRLGHEVSRQVVLGFARHGG